MIDRIGTFSQASALLDAFQRIQGRVATTQEQISSGKVGQHYQDVADQAGVLTSFKARAARTEALTMAGKEVQSRLSLQDAQLQQMESLGEELRLALGDALAANKGDGFMARVEAVYQSAAGILNTQVDGAYIYGGTRSDVPPVNAPTLSALVAAPALSDVFENAPLAQSQAIDEGVVVETGFLASDLATGLFQMIRDIATFEGGVNGPIGHELTQAQTQFLTTQFQAAPAVNETLTAAAAENGVRYGQVEDALTRLDDMRIYLKDFMGKIEDVDMAEAITRLNQDQAAAQAAARMIAELNSISLLNFLN